MEKVFFLELNEFNNELLQEAASLWNLKHVQRLTRLHRTQTFTADTYESDFLEPWVQWVSVHTGKPSSIHQIKHLGDVPHLETHQLWEKLSEKGISSGIWGAMNANRGSAQECKFFLPDPWTASERAYPEELNSLLEPLRYISKNYLNLSDMKLKRLMGFLFSQGLGFTILKEAPTLLANAIRFRGAPFVFIAFVEYLSTLLFLKYKKRYQPNFSLLFLNTLAHLQHHHWRGADLRNNKKIAFGMRYLDRTLGAIFSSLASDEKFVVANALSQKNTNEEKPWILYRQIDQAAFLRTVGISCTKVEPHMTHDAHLFFANEQDCKTAYQILTKATILGQPLFFVENYPTDPCKLFYRIAFTDAVPANTLFAVGGKTFPLQKLFKAVVQRTGKHIQHGTLYSSHPLFPDTIQNHEICTYLDKIF